MNDNIRETKLIIRIRKYNGNYGIGSVFDHEYTFIARQSEYSNNGIIKYSENIGFCSSENSEIKDLANIKTEIPFLVTPENFKKFKELINDIKNNPDCKYNETHYSEKGFDPKYYNYMSIIIDDEAYESNDKTIFEKLNDIVDTQQYSELTNACYKNMSNYMGKNSRLYDDKIDLRPRQDD